MGRYGGENELQRRFRATAESTSALLIAPTASGKTEAAAMAALDATYRSIQRIVYVAPTRALINDIVMRLEPGFAALNLLVVGRHGEMRASPKREAAAKCIVTTPESLDAAFQRAPPWLDQVGVLIIDELHVLDGTPRGTQLRALMSRLQQRAKSEIRVLAMSATVADPTAVATKWGGPSGPLALVMDEAGRIREFDISLGGDSQLRRWLSGREAPDKVLVFTNSRRRSDEVFALLDGSSDRVLLVHYSSLESAYRKEVEYSLRRLDRVTCVATSTLELGIDVGDIGAVALADAPWSSLSVTQRLGRAGRRDRSTLGRAFLADDRSLLRLVACALQPAEESDHDGADPTHYSVGVQQAISLIGASNRGRISAGTLAEGLRGTGIGVEPAAEILASLVEQGVLAPTEPTGSYQLTVPAERLLGAQQWSNFPEDRARWELAVAGRRFARVGLPGRPESGQVLRFAGRYWVVVRVDRSVVNLRATKPVPNPIEAVYGSTIPIVPAATAAMMRRVLIGEAEPNAPLAEDAEERLGHLKTELADVLREGNPVVRVEGGEFRLLTFAGTRANLLIMTATGAARADDLGVTYADSPPIAINGDIPDMLERAEAEYARLAGYLPLTRWFDFLPEPLQRAEISSWVKGPGVLDAITIALGRPVVPHDPRGPIEL